MLARKCIKGLLKKASSGGGALLGRKQKDQCAMLEFSRRLRRKVLGVTNWVSKLIKRTSS